MSSDWSWDRPDEISQRLDDLWPTRARCRKLEPVAADHPFTAELLRGLGVTGIEFAAWQSAHPAGLGTDLVPLSSDAVAAEPEQLVRVDGAGYFVALDVCRPLPFEDGCVDWVFAEHLIEHIPFASALAWLAEVRRILAPGGLLRLTTPDLAAYVAGFSTDNGFFARQRKLVGAAGIGPPMPQRRAFMFNQLFYLYGHRWIYDLDEVRYVLGAAGFDPDAVRRRSYREGSRPDVARLDRIFRKHESMYIEVNV
jgi:predicted SAM-dependent methyltransferase